MLLTELLGPLAPAFEESVADLLARDAASRLHARDHTLWQPDPTEVADRLGWLDCHLTMPDEVPGLLSFADACGDDGLERVVILGMGGSSLFPEVLDRTFGSRPDRLDLEVLDTTHPAAVARLEGEWPLARTLFLGASKSGSTIETRSHLERFWSDHADPGCFAVTTDPGSSLAELADQRKFRRTFLNPSDIGGRYSALSLFGLVPAALGGISPDGLLDGAAELMPELSDTGDGNPGLRLGAAMAAGARTGRDKLTLVLDHRIVTFGLWLEQLIAESTGKRGTGVLPVVGEPLGPPEVYGEDRLFVSIGDLGASDEAALDALASAGHPVVSVPFGGAGTDLLSELGSQVLLWETATALCGAALGINPFDQPDVAAAKAATQAVLDSGALPDIAEQPLASVLEQVATDDYIAIHAYVDPGGGLVDAVEDLRVRLRDELRVATTVGLGPRFLHSTGQLHKGGPPTGVFIQVVDVDPDPATDVAIPGAPFTFGTLLRAQAAGDLHALRDRGLRAARVAVADIEEIGEP